MTMRERWHGSATQLDDYVAGRASDVQAWSLERHLTACGTCRQRVAGALDGTPDQDLLARTQARIAARVDAATPHRFARPTRLRRARMLLGGASGPRVAWFLAVVCVLLISVILAALASIDRPITPMLVLFSPLLPVLGVAASYGPGVDPAHDIGASTPSGGLTLLLWRTLAVLGITAAATAAAIFATNAVASRSPVSGMAPLAWLLPSVTLTVLVVGLSSALRPAWAAAAVGTLWALGVATPTMLGGGELAWQSDHRWVILAAAVVASSAVLIGRKIRYSYSYQKGGWR